MLEIIRRKVYRAFMEAPPGRIRERFFDRLLDAVGEPKYEFAYEEIEARAVEEPKPGIRTIEPGRTYRLFNNHPGEAFLTAFSSYSTVGLDPHAEFFGPEINYRLGQLGRQGKWDLTQQEFVDLVDAIVREYRAEQARLNARQEGEN